MPILKNAWGALGEDPAVLGLERDHGAAVPLSSALPVGQFVHDAIAAASLSAALLVARRTGSAVPLVELDPIKIATAVTSEKHFRLAGEPQDAWAELSGFWPTADGWVRTHANYPHHRDRLLDALGLPTGTTADEFLAHVHARSAQEIEDLVSERGGVATVVRTEEEWREHPQAVAVAQHPLVGLGRLGEGPAFEAPDTTDDAPAGGIRVLDLTRVIAGPVATRTLALWGADVLRVDARRHPEIGWQHLDTGSGKRSTLLDLADAADRATFEELLAAADVVVTGYRAGALDRFGLAPDALAERHPGIVLARISAWGTTGPFADRRGFDSIVQAASGIARVESADVKRPGAMPAQALDHAAGYLLAAGVTSALRRRMDDGGSWSVEVSLARLAAELLAEPRTERNEPQPWQPTVIERADVTSAAAAPHYDGGPGDWAAPAVPWASSAPTWSDRTKERK